MINKYRQKTIAAIQYFAQNIKYPYKTKIFKLLFFLDEEHYKETGLTVTNLDYFTWSYGPVPKRIWFDLKEGRTPDYLKGKVKLFPTNLDEEDKTNQLEFRTISKPDLSIFTPRQLKILDNLIFIYEEIHPSMISEISHERNKPWDITKNQKGMNQKIDFYLSLSENSQITPEDASKLMSERDEMINNFPFESPPNAM